MSHPGYLYFLPRPGPLYWTPFELLRSPVAVLPAPFVPSAPLVVLLALFLALLALQSLPARPLALRGLLALLALLAPFALPVLLAPPALLALLVLLPLSALLTLFLAPLVQRLALRVLVRPAAVVWEENSRGRGRISTHSAGLLGRCVFCILAVPASPHFHVGNQKHTVG